MPISEDEIDYNRSREPQSTMSKAEIRKTHKPIMEKRRRARINHCLNEIKTLILEAMNKDVSQKVIHQLEIPSKKHFIFWNTQTYKEVQEF